MLKNKLKTAMIYFAACLIVILMACPFNLFAEEMGQEQREDRKGVETGLDESVGMPVLKGDLWQKMSHDEKVAFIWGFGHVISIEHYLMQKFPELKRDSFSEKAVEGMNNTPMNEVVARVDRYYEMHDYDIGKPVTSVLWDTMIKPNIRTGIAGRPLKNRQ